MLYSIILKVEVKEPPALLSASVESVWASLPGLHDALDATRTVRRPSNLMTKIGPWLTNSNCT